MHTLSPPPKGNIVTFISFSKCRCGRNLFKSVESVPLRWLAVMLNCTTRFGGTKTPAKAIASLLIRKKPPTGGVSRITSLITASSLGAL
jgi:hypothetical protein